mmetsp:Transcript_16238/g.46663  ORF Transcript_16238/g.46663 Transcript_16238/m.46663 type:complete len:249 (-) Transcript_16238:4-750(-)
MQSMQSTLQYMNTKTNSLRLGIVAFTIPTGGHTLERIKVLLGTREGFEDAGLVVLNGLGDGLPELLPSLDEVEGRSDGKIGDGGGVAVAELGVLEVDVGQDLKVLLLQGLELLLGLVGVDGHAEDAVADAGDARVEGGLAPIHNQVDAGALQGVLGVELVAVGGNVAKVAHDRATLPDCGGVVNLESWTNVAGVHFDELLRTSLTIGILDLDVHVEVFYNSDASMTVGGGGKNVKLHAGGYRRLGRCA